MNPLHHTLMRCIVDYDRMASGRPGYDPLALVAAMDALAQCDELIRSGTAPITAIETAFASGELQSRLIALAVIAGALAPSPLTCDPG